MNAHLKRWFTALLAVPILLIIIGYGSALVFALFISAVVAAAMVEYAAMVLGEGRKAEKIVAVVIALLVMGAAYSGGLSLILTTVTIALLFLFSLSLMRRNEQRADPSGVRNIIFGVLYIAVMMSYFLLIRADDNGRVWVFFLIVMAFSSDVSAFYTGRTWGRRKLMPSVSAGKTVEGALGGIAGCVVFCGIYAAIFLPELRLGHALLMGFLGSILGQLGDLSESTIKRASMVKDSGFIVPGHGGILDRLDSFLFIVPFVYYYKQFLLMP